MDRHLVNTAGLGTFPGAGTARLTWAGPLVLSPSGRLMSGRDLSIVGPVSSLTVCTPRPTAVRPVRAGPFHRRNHGLLFQGPRTCGFCLGSFGLGRPVAAGTLGEELKRIVRSMDFYGVVHGITFPGFLRCFRRSGGLASCLPSVGLGLSSPRLRQPILAKETGTVLSTKRLPFIQAALLAAKMVVVSPSEMRTPGETWAEIQLKTTGHVIAPPFCPRTYAWQRRKQTVSHATYLPKLQPERSWQTSQKATTIFYLRVR